LKTTKIYRALAELDVYELNRFDKFVHSPYFNQNKAMVALLELFIPFLKGKHQGELSKKEAWDRIYPGKAFNDTRFRKLNSDLLKLFEQFLAQETYESNPLHQASYLVESISDRKIEKLYNTVVSSVKRLSNRQLEKSSSFYYYQYQLEKNQYNLTSEFEKKFKKKTKYSTLNIEEIAKNLDIFYLGEKLKLYCTLLSWKNVFNLDTDLLFMEEIIKHVEKINYSNFPPIAMYYQVFKTYSDPDNVEHYYALRELIKSDIDQFPPEEAKDIYGAAQNFCIRMINRGKKDFLKENLDLYKEAINRGILFYNEELSPTTFRNIVISAVNLNEFEWAENFIHTHQDKLSEKHRENAVTFNMARLFWYKRDYPKVIEYLRNVVFDDMIYELNSKSMLIATYYETEEIDPLESLLESFKTFLFRNKKNIPEKRYKTYIQYIKYVKNLLKIIPGDKKAIQSLKTKIEASNQGITKKWLLEKVEELK
jgi:hypothetical protein